MKKILIYILCFLLLAACAPVETTTPTLPPSPIPTLPAATSTPMSSALWVSPAVPAALLGLAKTWNIPITADASLASQKLDVADSGSLWIYALVAPFATVTDDVTNQDLLSAWNATSSGPLAGRGLLMAESTLEALTALWGEPAPGAVKTVPAALLIDSAWAESAWAIIPFEDIQPKWKVLSLDGQSPIHKKFDADAYPLKINFGLTSSLFELPESNRDEAKLATVVLTGVTALVRATAATMELKNVTYPGELVGDWLREADVAHISNEVPFDAACPTPNFSYTNLLLCSDPKYLELFLDVGTDIIELTGDHFADRGVNAMLDTLAIYEQNDLPYYGGGANAEEARKPVLMNVNGNKIAFMGCNGKLKYAKATDTVPGAADCDYDFFVDQIREVKAQGYMVIFTFQHEECYYAGPCYTHLEGFHKVADAGADVVSGSQAHYPHIMEFRGDAFIHYGLGNLFFDQMYYTLPDGTIIDGTRREFLDRHVFYDGRYLGVEFLTAMLEDFSRPRPMTETERTGFLSEYFNLSGWLKLSPTPIPQPTATLTPIALP
jgi:hypothetical protein